MARLSVILPTRDRPRDLRRCLDALIDCRDDLRQTVPTSTLAEVVVIDDASVDPVALSSKHRDVLPIRLERNEMPIGAGRCRMQAVGVAAGDTFAFIDDDALPRGDWLSSIALHVPATALAITGRVLGFDEGLLSRARQARYDKRYSELGPASPVRFFAGGNSAVDAAAFDAVGGFSTWEVGSDNSLAEKMWLRGTPVAFMPDLVVAHRNSKGWRRACTDAFLSGRRQVGRTNIVEATQALRASGVGTSARVRTVNRALAALHIAAGFTPR